MKRGLQAFVFSGCWSVGFVMIGGVVKWWVDTPGTSPGHICVWRKLFASFWPLWKKKLTKDHLKTTQVLGTGYRSLIILGKMVKCDMNSVWVWNAVWVFCCQQWMQKTIFPRQKQHQHQELENAAKKMAKLNTHTHLTASLISGVGYKWNSFEEQICTLFIISNF